VSGARSPSETRDLADASARLGVAGFFVEPSPAVPLVGFSLSSVRGAAYDPEGKEGATRLMARLIRRTAGGRTATAMDELIDSLGGSLAVETTCSTLGIHGGVIARSLERFAALLAEVVSAPAFREDEFRLLLREAEGELVDTLDNDRALARRWFRRRLFAGHPYGRATSGTLASLKRIELSDLEQLYRKLLVKQHLLVGFAGDIGEDAALRFAELITKALPEGPALPDDVGEPTGPRGRRLVIVDKPERTQTQILIGGLGTHPRDADHTALHVANTIFGGTFTARLTQEVRAKRGWSYGAYSNLPFDRRRQAFSLWTFPKAEDAGPCIALQLQMLGVLRERGVTKAELARAKKYLVRSHAFAVDTASKRAGLRLDSALYELPERYYEEYTDRVQAVSLDDVNAAIRARIPVDDLIVTVLGTEADIGAALRDSIDGLTDVEVIPFDKND
jgi:zinc protease